MKLLPSPQPQYQSVIVPQSGQIAVEASNVSKRLGRREVLRGVDLRLEYGRTLAIIGPNGAGKTTLLRILATLMRPSTGHVKICDHDSVADPLNARRCLGVLFSATFMYPELSAAENLSYYAQLYGITQPQAQIQRLAVAVGLESRLEEHVALYSRGMAQRLSLVRALLHRPLVLLLDEPDAGLDPAMTSSLKSLLRVDSATERAVILTCHDLSLALDLADDVAILADGRFLFASPTRSLTLAELEAMYRSLTY